MKHRFSGLRGSAFIKAYKSFLSDDAETAKIRNYFQNIIDQNGKFTLKDLGKLAQEFRLPLTICDDCLPDITQSCSKPYSSGSWQRAKDRGVKAKDIGVVWNEIQKTVSQ